MTDNRTQQIRRLNDQFRKSGRGGRVVVTAGIKSLGMKAIILIMEKVKNFDAFNHDNDPYGEHDFGSFDHNGDLIYFKIDYYDKVMEYGSTDPANAAVTTRLLTILLAEEY